jgi:hypothetical protein
MPKRSPEEVWRQLVDEAGEDEVERAASVSVAQAEKELAQAGFDVAAERANGAALIDELESAGRLSGRVAIADAEKAAPEQAGGGADGRPVDGREPRSALGANGAHVVKRPGPSRRVVRALWFAVPAAAALAWGAIALMTGGGEGDRAGSPGAGHLKAARTLREKARHECAQNEWKACLDDLDAAKRLDPNGEDEASQRDRAAAEGALRSAPR